MNAALCGLVISCVTLVGAAKAPQTVIIENDDGPVCFSVEIADTHWSRAKGLMHRDRLEGSHGMLFVYDAPRPVTFWMKNVTFPLDLLFIAPSGEVVRIVEHAAPDDPTPIPSRRAVSSVLEIAGGASRRAQITEGMQLSLVTTTEDLARCENG